MKIYIPDRRGENIYHFFLYMIANLRHLTGIPDTIYANLVPSYIEIILQALYPQATLIDTKVCPEGVEPLFQSPEPASRESGVTPEEYRYVRSVLLPLLETYQPTRVFSPHVYISRNRDSGKRRLLNEHSVLEKLPDLQSIVLGELSIMDQLYVFYKAKLIVSIHGGGLVHLLVCTSNPTIIELASPHMIHLKHFEHIAQTLSLTYKRYLVDAAYPTSYESDLFVRDPTHFQLFLSKQFPVKI
jgi:hypothetical protein